MTDWLRQFVAPPVFEDEDKTRTAGILNVVLLAVLVATVLGTLAVFALEPEEILINLLLGVVLIAVILGLRALMRRGKLTIVGTLVSLTLWASITFLVCTGRGARDPSMSAFFLVVAIASLLLGGRGAIIFGLLAILTAVGIVWGELNGYLPISSPLFTPEPLGPVDMVTLATTLALMTLLLRYAVRNIAQGFERARRNERELRERNWQLQEIRASLEAHNRYLQTTVQQYVDYMAEVARGNLSARLPLDGQERDDDPLVLLGHNLNDTVASLQRMTQQIRDTANNLTSAVSKILATTGQQASDASDQSLAISQISSTIEQVRAIAEQTTRHAQGVADLARRTAQVSDTGQKAVTETVQGMQQIKERVESIFGEILALSEQTEMIDQIITMIGQIATQSNLLALNASVEAARAGEVGRGFAVVAQEVRYLAGQSRTATEQVQEILSDVQDGVEAAVLATEEGRKGTDVGVRLAGEAGQAIDQLGKGVSQSTESARQIAEAASQQQEGMEQIVQSMEQIHQITARSEAGAQQVEQAAEELNALARRLHELVAQYRL